MPGNYAKPFRLPPQGAVPYSRPNHLSGCDVAPRYAQSTLVRASDGKTPPTIGNIPPFPRLDQTYDQGPEGSNICPTSPPGTCGSWLLGGDLNGLSAQEITDTVNDILACGAGTVLAVDHNCYSKPGTSVSYKKCHKSGGKWVIAQKYHQGIFGINDRCDPSPITAVACTTGAVGGGGGVFSFTNGFNNVAPQVRYRTVNVTDLKLILDVTWYDLHDPDQNGPPGLSSCEVKAASTVGRYTGIQSYTASYTPDANNYLDPADLFGLILGFSGNGIIDYFTTHWLDDVPEGTLGNIAANGANSWQFVAEGNSGIPDGTVMATVSIGVDGNCSRTLNNAAFAIVDGVLTLISTTTETESVAWSNTGLAYSYSETWNVPMDTGGTGPAGQVYVLTKTAALELSDPYTSSDCYQDWLDLMAEWDLTSDTLYPFRTDEELANAPLMVYDEAGPTQPTPTYQTMNDYTQAQNEDLTWPQRPYLDQNNYVWESPSGGFATFPVAAGGNILKTPMRTGAVVSHNLAGSDRHFWFNYAHLHRIVNPDDGSVDWLVDEHGGYSDGNLPPATMRWLDNLAAQYDAAKQGASASQGNLPQAWLRESYGVLIGGKYVEAKELWTSVNFGRPYGLDKFAVDQVTVCAVNSGSGAGGSLVVTPMLYASAPLAAGGLTASGNVMIGGDGVYPVTGLTAVGDGTFTLTIGAKLCAIPSGADIGAGYVGAMRFWGAPPFGLTACSATYDGTADTNFVIPATPYWAAVGPGNPSLSVDLYLPDPDNGNPRTLLNTVTLTKYGAWAASTAFVTGQKILVNGQVQTATTGGTSGCAAPTWNTTVDQTTTDGSVTWTAGGIVPNGATVYAVGDYHDAAFIIPHLHYSGQQFLPEYDDNRPKGDFVQVQFGFDFRAADSRYTGPAQTWNGANLTPPNPQPGELPAQVADASLRFTPCCPSVVGFAGPVEHFRNQKLSPFPTEFPFDDSFFSFWMGTVATAMVDPFWQAPFAPETEAQFASDDGFQWLPDDGSGLQDNLEGTPPVRYYPAPPLVEARATKPGNLGWGQNETPPDLPAGVTLAYDVTKNVVTPQPVGPPTGILIGDATGAYGNVATIYGFYLNACANIAASGRFSQYYKLFCYC